MSITKPRKRNILISFLTLFLLFSSLTFVVAAPPFQTSEATVGLELRFPQTDVVQQNQEIEYHVHVFNATNGLPIFPPDASCIIHLYNSNGSHVLQEDLVADGNGKEWKLDIARGNFSTIQRMSAITLCNSSTEGGFVSFGFDVTPSGRGGMENVIFIILMILVLYGLNLFGFFGKNIPLTVLTGMALIFFGLYTIQNGIIIYRDTLTLYFSYITIGWGFISAMWALIEEFT